MRVGRETGARGRLEIVLTEQSLRGGGGGESQILCAVLDSTPLVLFCFDRRRLWANVFLLPPHQHPPHKLTP